MKSHVRVAVIGGGVVGCSALHHLTRLGGSGIKLIEVVERPGIVGTDSRWTSYPSS